MDEPQLLSGVAASLSRKSSHSRLRGRNGNINMFWRFGGITNFSTIDNILDKQDVTLDELLEEQDLIQELKAQNAKLIEFLRDDSVLDRLLKYVVAPSPSSSTSQPPATTSTEKRSSSGGLFGKSRARSQSSGFADPEGEKAEAKRTKFAFVACEILSSEVWSISESLLDNIKHLKQFWDFVKQDTPLNAVQAGYFTKVNEALVEKKPAAMVAFIKSLDDVVPNMMKHVDCPMIMDLLLKIISLEKDAGAQGVVGWLQEQNLIPMLLELITSGHPAVTQTSAGDFLKAIITISANATGQDTSVIGPNELTRQLVSGPCIQSLVNEMLKGGNPLTVGVGIVIEVIRKNNSDYDSETQIGPEPKSTDPIYLGNLLKIFANHIPDFMNLILSTKHTVINNGISISQVRKELNVAWGSKIEPLGFDRFKTCELMAELLHCSNMGLLNERGSEADIVRRDAERERLKAEGKLAAAQIPEAQANQELATSVDSHGFHHAETLSPLGESPEHITERKLEVQNTGLEEDFEKVNLEDTAFEDLNEKSNDDSDESRKSSSLLTQQFQALKGESSSDAPAPLFASKQSDGSAAVATENEYTEHAPASEISTEVEQVITPGKIERDDDGQPLVGDLLKMMFVEHHVVPTILDFFFRFPWNNFLHNVVYDVVQQVFNGSMDRGYNRNLAVDLFETGDITNRVVDGQERSDKSQAEQKMRLGYMGHLTLIAEEIVKFTERQPPELLSQIVMGKMVDQRWINYVENTLTETRDRDNAVLGGIRPDHAMGTRQAVLNALNPASSGYSTSSALADAGIGGEGGVAELTQAGGSSNLLSGFGGSDDEDEEDIEDREISEAVANARRASQSVDDEEQTANHPTSTASGVPSSSSSSSDASDQPSAPPPPIPAPLSIPPSRARRQLAVRLAEKKRLAEESAITSSSASPPPPPAMSSSTFSPRASDSTADGATAATGGNKVGQSGWTARRAAAARGHESDDEGSSEDDNNEDDDKDDDDDDDDEEDGNGRGLLIRMPQRGSQRSLPSMLVSANKADGDVRPNEENEDDEEDEDDGEEQDTASRHSFKLKRQTTREAVKREPLDVGEGSSDEDDDELSSLSTQQTAATEAKRREQDKLLRQWGLSEDDEEERREGRADDDNDDNDDDSEDNDNAGGSEERKAGASEDSDHEEDETTPQRVPIGDADMLQKAGIKRGRFAPGPQGS